MNFNNIRIIAVLTISALCLFYAVISDILDISAHRAAITFFDWFTPALMAIIFSTLGVIKLVGQKRGIVGGGGKSWKVRLTAGYCPTWSRPVNLAAPYVLLGVGLFHLGILVWLVSIR